MSNRLAGETSPYLLQHADNPVHWFPWGPEALARARQEDKPIFLSIGYAACHWCHVMAHESFADPEIARLLNEHFVSVKVDREERPDLDALYMQSVVAMTGQGGWPLSVFLTPAGEPFFGGTYFPPKPRYGMPAFGDLLRKIALLWQSDRKRLEGIGAELAAALRQIPRLRADTETWQPDLLEEAARTLFQGYDWRYGGWGPAPKFPQPAILRFLMQEYAIRGDGLARDMALHGLRSMARGGMYDLVGGGFHRYAVDEQWLVPHFEKMLYDNALLADAYLEGHLLSGDEELGRVARQTLEFMLREMRSPQGGFYASFDADSEGVEGKYYLWSWQALQEAIPDEAMRALATRAYGLNPEGNFGGRNIPFSALPAAQLADELGLSEPELKGKLDAIRHQLLQARARRTQPAVDDKIITAWNGLTLRALARAARYLDWAPLLPAAQELANFLLEALMPAGQLKRTYRAGRARFTAYLEDHAALGLGLLELYQTDFNPRWLQEARRQAAQIVERFSDPKGGFFDTHADHEPLLARPKTLQDVPIPSGNSLAVGLLQRLYMLDGDDRWLEPAHGALLAMQGRAGRHPTAFAAWLSQLRLATSPPIQVALLGDLGEAGMKAMIAQARSVFLPHLVMAAGDPAQPGQAKLLQGRTLLHGRATAYLCRAFHCQLPTNDPAQLRLQLLDLLPQTDANRQPE